MARGRFISESVAKDLRLNSLSVEAELVYLMTIPHLDRDGLIEGDTEVVYGTVCPKRRIFIDRIGEFIREWVQVGLVTMYDSDEGSVLWFRGFTKNQVGLRYDRETPSKFPPPPGHTFGPGGIIVTSPPKTPEPEAPLIPPETPPAQDETLNLSPVDSIRQESGTLPDVDDNCPPHVRGGARPEVQVKVEAEVEGHTPEPATTAAAKKPFHRTISDFVGAYERIWGLTVALPYIGEQIQEWENRVTYDGWCYALQECSDRKNQGHWSYLRPILERIAREGYQPKQEIPQKQSSTVSFAFEDVHP